jgi:hypothetical protein
LRIALSQFAQVAVDTFGVLATCVGDTAGPQFIEHCPSSQQSEQGGTERMPKE